MPRFSRTPEKTERARKLRSDSTAAERKLWSYLRGAGAGASFRRQHPLGPYFADFCCASLKLIIELDGGQHAAREGYDMARTRFLEAQGYEVMRFWNIDVMEGFDGVWERILWAARRKQHEQM